jgi:hypothetical protein
MAPAYVTCLTDPTLPFQFDIYKWDLKRGRKGHVVRPLRMQLCPLTPISGLVQRTKEYVMECT